MGYSQAQTLFSGPTLFPGPNLFLGPGWNPAQDPGRAGTGRGENRAGCNKGVPTAAGTAPFLGPAPGPISIMAQPVGTPKQ